jgi:tetratricopeptide (TPR) repeat protein
MRSGVFAAVLMFALATRADELQRAHELAWARQFAEAEVLYRRIVAAQPDSAEARLGLARVVMWQGRYGEAISLFAGLDGVDAIEGRATAQYWGGDHRAAARGFRRVLAIDPRRELARRSLAEIESAAVPSQRVIVRGATDDQPLDMLRGEVSATFYSDVQTQWSATVGHYEMDAERVASGAYAGITNETTVRAWTFGASAGLFTFPDGVRQPVGGASVRRGALTLRVERHPELASAPSLTTHVASTAATFRWDWNRNWLASAELTHRSYSDHNEGRAAAAFVLIPFRHHDWTLWSGASVSLRDTDESRFTLAGRYDPYWTPDDLREARAVLALERKLARGSMKVHADAGHARDRGRDRGVPFNRSYSPWRAGITADYALGGRLRLEAGVDRSITVDYRVTSFHVSLVRRP